MDHQAVRRRHAVAAALALATGVVVGVAGAGVAGATGVPSVSVTTVVTTTRPIYEFTTWFGESATEISCEIDYRATGAVSIPDEAYCMSSTAHLTHHVTVSSTGVVRTCVGVECGSNAGLGTPSFYPGTEVRSGPFACVVSAHAVTCREHHARGFVITARAITKL